MFTLRITFVVALLQISIQVVDAEDLHIPVLVGQTGASASLGRNETDAYTLAVEEWNARGGVNGKRVVLQLEDTATSAKQILSAFQLHATRGAKVVVGPTWLDGFPAIIPITRLRDESIDALIIFVWDERSLVVLLQQSRGSLPNVPLATVHDGAGWLTNPVFKPLLPRLTYTRFRMSDDSFEQRFKVRFGYDLF